MKVKTLVIWMGLFVLIGLPLKVRAEDSHSRKSPPLVQALDDIQTPEDIVQLMRQEFKFAQDDRLFESADRWQKPDELWQRKKGDCEDYALFAQYALKKLDVESYVVSFYGRGGYGHTITLFRDRGLYSVINEDQLYRYGADSVESALTKIYPAWTWGAIAIEKNGRGEMVKEIRNPNPPSSLRLTENGIAFGLEF